MLDDSFSVEREVGSALRVWGVMAVPGHSEDAQLITELVRQRDLYQTMALTLEASNLTANERIAQLERERSILAERCAAQAHMLAGYLAQPAAELPAVDPHPIHTAVAAMQRGGLR